MLPPCLKKAFVSVVDDGSTVMVPMVVIVPPVSPAPAVMLLTVPVPTVSAPQAHPLLPVLFGTSPFAHDCGSWNDGARFRDPAPVIGFGLPSKPVPASTLVTVPAPLPRASLAQAHCRPSHFITCPAVQVSGNRLSPNRFMNAAICSRLTKSFGQYSVVEVQPSVIPRFLSQVTLPQNGLVSSTSVKPAQGRACADPATPTPTSTANSPRIICRIAASLARPRLFQGARGTPRGPFKKSAPSGPAAQCPTGRSCAGATACCRNRSQPIDLPGNLTDFPGSVCYD